jgi:hypothetical protein
MTNVSIFGDFESIPTSKGKELGSEAPTDQSTKIANGIDKSTYRHPLGEKIVKHVRQRQGLFRETHVRKNVGDASDQDGKQSHKKGDQQTSLYEPHVFSCEKDMVVIQTDEYPCASLSSSHTRDERTHSDLKASGETYNR